MLELDLLPVRTIEIATKYTLPSQELFMSLDLPAFDSGHVATKAPEGFQKGDADNKKGDEVN